MENLIKYLSTIPDANTATPVDTAKIITYQKELLANDFAAMPQDYIIFLHHFNGYAYDGSFVYGIHPLQDCFLDILAENALANHPSQQQNLLLGFSESDYLCWNQESQQYQIIDKFNFMVLYTYTDCASAIRHILKIEDEQYL